MEGCFAAASYVSFQVAVPELSRDRSVGPAEL